MADMENLYDDLIIINLYLDELHLHLMDFPLVYQFYSTQKWLL
jgi:hypothetical protein